MLDKVEELREKGTPDGTLDVGVTLMHPVQPMLAMVSELNMSTGWLFWSDSRLG